MHWINLNAKDRATASLEKNPWDDADQLRANSGLKAQEYSSPIPDPGFGTGSMFVQSRCFVAERLRCRLPHGDRLVAETRGDELCPDWICP